MQTKSGRFSDALSLIKLFIISLVDPRSSGLQRCSALWIAAFFALLLGFCPHICSGAEVVANANGNLTFEPVPFEKAPSGSVSKTYDDSLYFGSVSSRARASFGTLGVYSRADYNGAAGGDSAQGTAIAQFQEGFTISDPAHTGEIGTMVFKLKVSGSLASTTTRTAGPAAPHHAYATLAVSGTSGGTGFSGTESLAPGETENTVAGQPFLNREVTAVVRFTFGVQMYVTVRLDASVVAAYDAGYQASSTVDMDHTLEWGGIVSVNDSGANALSGYTIITETGTDYSGPIQDPPKLTLLTLSPGQMQLSWSTNYPSFILKSAGNLASAWETVGSSATISGTEYTLSIAAPATNQFFRLQKD
jgi:hypothetical protein